MSVGWQFDLVVVAPMIVAAVSCMVLWANIFGRGE